MIRITVLMISPHLEIDTRSIHSLHNGKHLGLSAALGNTPVLRIAYRAFPSREEWLRPV